MRTITLTLLLVVAGVGCGGTQTTSPLAGDRALASDAPAPFHNIICEDLEIQDFTPAEWPGPATFAMPSQLLAFAGESPELVSLAIKTDRQGRSWLSWDVLVDRRGADMESVAEEFRNVLGEGSRAEAVPASGPDGGVPPYARSEVRRGECTLQLMTAPGGSPLLVTFRAGGRPDVTYTLGQALDPLLGIRPNWLPADIATRFADLPVTEVELAEHDYIVSSGFFLRVADEHQARVTELSETAEAVGLRVRLTESSEGGWLLSLRAPEE